MFSEGVWWNKKVFGSDPKKKKETTSGVIHEDRRGTTPNPRRTKEE